MSSRADSRLRSIRPSTWLEANSSQATGTASGATTARPSEVASSVIITVKLTVPISQSVQSCASSRHVLASRQGRRREATMGQTYGEDGRPTILPTHEPAVGKPSYASRENRTGWPPTTSSISPSLFTTVPAAKSCSSKLAGRSTSRYFSAPPRR